MQVIQINIIGFHSSQAGLAGIAHIFRAAVNSSGVLVFRPDKPKLCGQHDFISHSSQGFTDQFLIVPAAIHIGCVEESDARIKCLMNNFYRSGIVPAAIEF